MTRSNLILVTHSYFFVSVFSKLECTAKLLYSSSAPFFPRFDLLKNAKINPLPVEMCKPFTKLSSVLKALRKKLYENIIGNGEKAGHKQFLRYQNVFNPIVDTFHYLNKN